MSQHYTALRVLSQSVRVSLPTANERTAPAGVAGQRTGVLSFAGQEGTRGESLDSSCVAPV
eukprot:gene8850-1210_t